MTIRVDETRLIDANPIGDSLNSLQGQWLSKKFRTFDEIADFLNDARVNLEPKQIVTSGNRFYVLFLVDSTAKIVKKTRKKKGK